MMFAMITPALITGSLVGRMKFKALFLFVAIWSVIVYRVSMIASCFCKNSIRWASPLSEIIVEWRFSD